MQTKNMLPNVIFYIQIREPNPKSFQKLAIRASLIYDFKV